MVLKAISTAALPLRHWPSPGEWTYQDYRQLPDDGYLYEIIEGEIYMAPAPNIGHQRASGELEYILQTFVKQNDLGIVLHAPCDLVLPGGTPVQPDIMFITKEKQGIITPQAVEGTPDLIIEILSPTSHDHDRRRKFSLYEQAGVPEYWLVDHEARTIEIFVLTEGSYVLSGSFGADKMATSQVLAGFTVAVDEVIPL